MEEAIELFDRNLEIKPDDSETGSTSCFHRNEPDHEIFNKVLAKKRRSISIPFFERRNYMSCL